MAPARSTSPLLCRVRVLVEAHRAGGDGHVDAEGGVGHESGDAHVGGLLKAQHVPAEEVPARGVPSDEGARVRRRDPTLLE
jgi:hypothetical protein